MKPIIISGKIGAGKTSLCKLFEKKNYLIINADTIAKDLIRKDKRIQKELIETFGVNIIEEKLISFNKLRKILCSSKKNKDAIDGIVHPVFYDKIHKIISSSKDKKIIIEIPLIETCKLLKVDNILVFIKNDK